MTGPEQVAVLIGIIAAALITASQYGWGRSKEDQ